MKIESLQNSPTLYQDSICEIQPPSSWVPITFQIYIPFQSVCLLQLSSVEPLQGVPNTARLRELNTSHTKFTLNKRRRGVGGKKLEI